MPVVPMAVVIQDPGALPDVLASTPQALADAGVQIQCGLGPFAAAVAGSEDAIEALAGLLGQAGIAAVVPAVVGAELPVSLDVPGAELILAWLATLDPDLAAAKDDAALDGQSWDILGGCGR